jgi:hypothetical protein
MAGPPRIERCVFGLVVVDGRSYTRDLIIFPDRVLDGWRRLEGHRLIPEDLAEVLRDPPEVLIVGQGVLGRMWVPPETRSQLEGAGMKVHAEPTVSACETYNRLRETQRVVAALHLTC